MIKITKKMKTAMILLAALITVASALLLYNIAIPDSIAYSAGGELPEFCGAVADDGSFDTAAAVCNGADGVFAGSFQTEYKLLGIIPVKKVRVDVYKNLLLYPGGMPFGVKFFTDGILVVGFADVDGGGVTSNPAYDAGIRLKDLIIKANGKLLSGAAEFTDIIEHSDGKCVTLTCRRGKEEYTCNLSPKYSDAEGRFKTGMWIRDSGAGIGTVTFVVPENNVFGGLGHGICDVDTGELIPMGRGIISDVTVSGLVKGIAGNPGEIKGYFNSGKTGSLLGNTDCGVYGIFGTVPKSTTQEKLPIGLRADIKEGEAQILCTLDDGGIGKYGISISEINREATGSKCFTIKITDARLIEKTGGIIQGMSGSPIIQNGKIIGAVTHVLINDPTTGYGIFIENMLSQMSDYLD